MSNTPNEMVRWALDYARRGWPVLPLHTVRAGRCSCGKADCSSPGKHPRTPKGLKDATTNPETIAGWWGRWPAANIGIATGAAAGIVVIDVDPRHGGRDSWRGLLAEHGDAPTLTAHTGGGGEHFIFGHPGGKVGNRSGVLPGVDVRGDGGYIVAPPSVHASGGRYAWPEGWREQGPAPMPAWLWDLIARPIPAPPPVEPQPASRNGDGLGRLMADASLYAARAGGAAEGGRNAAAFSLAGHLAAFVTDDGLRLNEAQILDLMRPWNHRNTPPLPDRELSAAVASAMSNGTPRAPHEVSTAPRTADNGKASRNGKAEPVKLESVEPYRPFPVEALPPAMRRFVEAVAAATGTDPAYAALAALVTAAGCIGNRAAVLVKGGWTQPAVLWGALVGRSSATKSPVLKLTTRPLFELYKRERAAYAEALSEHARAMEHHAIRMSDWKREQKQGPASDPPEAPEHPREKRVVVSDTTIEKLGCLLQDNPLGLLLVRDELAAWIGSFDRYAAGGKGSDGPAWLSMHDAAPVTIDRKSAAGTIFCERAAVSVLGTIQPGTLRRVFGRAEREAGLLGRVLLAYPPERPALWTDDELSDETAAEWRELLNGLLAIEPGIDDEGDPRPRFMPLAEDAKRLFVEWLDRHAHETADLASDDLAAYFGKLKGGCIRFALVLECVNVATGAGGRSSIGPDAMRQAMTIAEWFKREGRRVYGLLAEDDETRELRRLVELVQRKGGAVTVREWQRARSAPTAEVAEAELNRLAETGAGQWEHPAPGPKGGHPAKRFVVADTAPTSAPDTDTTPPDAPENGGSVSVRTVSECENDTPVAPANTPDDGADWGCI